MRDYRPHADDFRCGQHPRHRALRGRGERAPESNPARQAIRARSQQGDRMTVEQDGIVVANAPVSYGAFELTVGIDPHVPDAALVLDEVAGAGYAGIDLGPVGYLGDRDGLASALSSRGLLLCGGFFELPFSDSPAMRAALPGLAALLDVFDSAPPPDGALKPKPTLADAGSDARRALPC